MLVELVPAAPRISFTLCCTSAYLAPRRRFLSSPLPNSPAITRLASASTSTRRGWHNALVEYLEQRSPYTAQELSAELLRRNEFQEDGKVMVFEEFVLEALSGDL